MSEKAISKITIRDTTLSTKDLISPDAKRFVDPRDKRHEATITFNKSPYTNFVIARIIQGITDQPKTKHLILIEESFKHLFYRGGSADAVHGHTKCIPEGIIHLPINQAIDVGTTFTLSVDNIDGRNAVTILSDRLTLQPGDRLPKGELPFNRRTYLMHLLPGEIIEGKFRVGCSDNFSIREVTYFARPETNVLVFGTQLNTPPSDTIGRVVDGMRILIGAKINNSYKKLIYDAGFEKDEVGPMFAYIEKTLKELEKFVV